MLGVHFALTPEQHDAVLAAAGVDAALELAVEEIEETWDEEFVAQSDKAWWGVHLALTGGEEVNAGEFPLNATIFGTRLLTEGDDMVMALTDADDVPAVARALDAVTRGELQARYERIDEELRWPEYGAEDFDYTWEGFVDIRALWEVAAALGRSVLFSAA